MTHQVRNWQAERAKVVAHAERDLIADEGTAS